MNHDKWTQALNPGQPELPDWVYNGAILGVQGGTDTMLMRLEDARAHGIQVTLVVNKIWSFSPQGGWNVDSRLVWQNCH